MLKRLYTRKSFELMKRVRKIILIVTSPLWFPFYLLVLIGIGVEEILDYLDDKLDQLLDKYIPQIK